MALVERFASGRCGCCVVLRNMEESRPLLLRASTIIVKKKSKPLIHFHSTHEYRIPSFAFLLAKIPVVSASVDFCSAAPSKDDRGAGLRPPPDARRATSVTNRACISVSANGNAVVTAREWLAMGAIEPERVRAAEARSARGPVVLCRAGG
jgi:hypothetical protein